MIKEAELALRPEEIDSQTAILSAAAAKLQIKPPRIRHIEIIKRSIDARGRQVLFRLVCRIYIDEPFIPAEEAFSLADISQAPRVLIAGAGPAGLFAALRCIELGLKPVIVERGKDVKQRRRDLAAINKQGLINPESNYCYGEGGAGTYSDGKLYTRSNKRGDVNKVLKFLVRHGAPEDILIDARPHIGTNKLPHIITAIRETILEAGGEVRFDTRLTGLLISKGKLQGIETAAGDVIEARALILATGHSARDIFDLLRKQDIQLEAKSFALGVRIEHPQELIDMAQYHSPLRHENLPPAYYSLVEQVDGRGVFSFCMCPGGIIAPCATGFEEIVVNGWSPSKRNNPFANSGMVVQVDVGDVPGAADPFKLLDFQKAIEYKAYEAGGGNLVAPAQRMADFVNGRLSANLPRNSYLPGTRSAMLDEVLPGFIASRLKKAFPAFGKKMKNYFTNEAVLVGVESRTSSPVRIPRHKESYQHPDVGGLFPCGEGAGYAGGIVSAAIDGMNCADAVQRMFSG